MSLRLARNEELDFCVNPLVAGGNFCRVRLLVDATLAAWFPFEMFDRVRDVGFSVKLRSNQKPARTHVF